MYRLSASQISHARNSPSWKIFNSYKTSSAKTSQISSACSGNGPTLLTALSNRDRVKYFSDICLWSDPDHAFPMFWTSANSGILCLTKNLPFRLRTTTPSAVFLSGIFGLFSLPGIVVLNRTGYAIAFSNVVNRASGSACRIAACWKASRHVS